MPRFALLLLSVIFVMSVRALADEPTRAVDETRRARVFAQIGSEAITVGDIEDLVAAWRPHARKQLSDDPDQLRKVADAEVENELFYQGAAKLGYAEDPEVQRFVNQTLVKVYVRKEFEEAVTPDDVPAADVAAYYDAHPDEFRRPEMRRARHILVASKAEAEEILNILKSDKAESFRGLAKQRSIDTETNVRGGDLLYFTAEGEVVGRDAQGTVDSTLVAAAFSLAKAGDLAGPLDLGDGKWSVLELTGIRPERVQTFEQASAQIRRKLWREEREGAIEALLNRLRAEVKPEVHPERIEAISFAPKEQPPAR